MISNCHPCLPRSTSFCFKVYNQFCSRKNKTLLKRINIPYPVCFICICLLHRKQGHVLTLHSLHSNLQHFQLKVYSSSKIYISLVIWRGSSFRKIIKLNGSTLYSLVSSQIRFYLGAAFLNIKFLFSVLIQSPKLLFLCTNIFYFLKVLTSSGKPPSNSWTRAVLVFAWYTHPPPPTTTHHPH